MTTPPRPQAHFRLGAVLARVLRVPSDLDQRAPEYPVQVGVRLLRVAAPLAVALALLVTLLRGNTPLWQSTEFLVAIAFSLVALVAWLLVSAASYTAASALIVFALAGFILWNAASHHHLDVLHFLLFVIPLSRLLLSTRAMKRVLASVFLASLMLPLVVPGWDLAEVVVNGLSLALLGGIFAMLLLGRLSALEHRHVEQVVETTEKYRLLLEHSPLGIIVYVDGQTVYANSVILDIIGARALDEILGWQAIDFVHPDDHVKLAQRDDEHAEHYWGKPIQERIVRLDGKIRDLEVVPIRTTFDGEPAVQVIVHDITHQKRAEMALQHSEARLRVLLDALPDLLFRLDRNGIFLDYRVTNSELHTSPETFLGKSIAEVFPYFGEDAMQAISRTLATGKIQTFHYQLPIDDQLGNYEARVVPSGDDEVTIIVRDVTQTLRTQNALRQSEARQQAILSAIPDLIFTLDRAGTFLDVRARDERMLVAPVDEMLGRTMGDMVPQPAADLLMSGVARALETGIVQTIEYEITVPAGMLYQEARLVVSGPEEVLLLVRNITERKQSEATLQRRDAILEALVYAGEQLLTSGDLDTIMPRVLARLGEAVQASRVYIYQNQPTGDGDLALMQRVEWLAAQHIPRIDAPKLHGLSYRASGLERWSQALSQEHPIYGLARDFPAQERALLDAHSILSVVIVPIFVGDEWFGVLSIDNCDGEREWLPVEVEALHSVARTLGAAISRQRIELAEREQRQLSDALRDVAAALGSTLDRDEMFRRLLDNVGQIVPYTMAHIIMLEGNVGRIVFQHGFERFGLGEGLWDLQINPTNYPPLESILDSGEPTIVADTSALGAEYSRVLWGRSHLCIPMHAEGKVIGIITLVSMQTDTFTAHNAERLKGFADQAAIAIDNTRLYTELSRHVDEMAALHRGTSFLFASLTSSAEMTEIGQQIAQAVANEFAEVDCGVYLIDPEGNQCTLLGQTGKGHTRASGPLALGDTGPVVEAIRTESQVYVPLIEPDPETAGEHPAQSELVVPLVTAKGPIGVLDLKSAEPHAFAPQDRSILAAFAERAAAVLDNRQLYEEIRRYTDDLEQRVLARTTDLSVRNAVAQTLSSSLDMEEMLSGVLKTTAEELNVRGGAIYLLSQDSETLKLAAHYGVPEEYLSLVTGITPGTSDFSPSESHSGQGQEVDIAQKTGISAVLSVPIWRQGHMQGIITLIHDEPRPWRTEETHMLDAIGRQIGVALANASLYSEAVRREAHIRTILRNVADGLLVFDRANNLILMNPAAEALFAFYPNDLGGAQQAASKLMAWFQAHDGVRAGRTSVEFMLPADALVGSGNSILDQCLRQGCDGANRPDPAWPCWLQESGTEEATLPSCPILQRLERRAIQAQSAEVRDTDGADLGTVIALHDVTYFRELDELKGRFVSTVSHELRTPLSSVMLQVSTLLKYYDRFEDDERRDMLAEVEQQAYILRELIEDILELSRFDSKRAMPQKRWINLADQFQGVLTSLRPVLEEKSLQLDISRFDEDCFLEGDPRQLERVFRNLMSNAIKYTPESGEITVTLENKGDEIRVEVADTGVGIPPEEQPYIFDRFFRAEHATKIASGTGLGLSITKEIIDLHDGRIGVRSQPGVGSTFVVYLPVRTQENSPDGEQIAQTNS